ncbi:MAG: signal peptidase I [Clostridia bacterium]|nr:signal peptidase I [Clostridia bacterium]MBR4540387.1 signal peptidase I [Clostridia bacterium]
MQIEKQPVSPKENIFSRYWAWRKKRKAIAKEKEKNMTRAQKVWSWLVLPLYALLIAMAVHLFFGEFVRVDGTSMTNTLQNNEVVWCSKLSYIVGEPQRNDIVICHYPGRMNERGAQPIHLSGGLTLNTYTIFIKRLVALPGDTVEITGGHLYVNGELVEDPEKMGSVPRDYAKRTLGEDEYFVVGDNRLTSHDSRSSDVGPISRSEIMGKVTYVMFPWQNHRVAQ